MRKAIASVSIKLYVPSNSAFRAKSVRYASRRAAGSTLQGYAAPCICHSEGREVDASSKPIAERDPIKIRAYRRLPLILLGFVTLSISSYSFMVYSGYKKDMEVSKTMNVPLDVSDRFNRSAENYDDEVGWMEWGMGIEQSSQEVGVKSKRECSRGFCWNWSEREILSFDEGHQDDYVGGSVARDDPYGEDEVGKDKRVVYKRSILHTRCEEVGSVAKSAWL